MTSEPINEFPESLKADIKNSLQANGKLATGQTAQKITVTNDDDGAQLQLPGYLQLLETGRGPTSSNPVAGDPPMIERIQAWCRAKGIPGQAIWAVKKSIDKKGFKGTPGILSEPLSEENINLRLDPVARQIADIITQQIIDSIGPKN
ncbi:MAG: hypothetical protein JSU01_16205 [Bacteroidetes bacterium]|nr:hypothetical protein [Bacteroidota bacterium]